MSIKTLLTPIVSEWLLSDERLHRRRDRAERRRVRRGAPHDILYFHQVDDPYSALAAQCLPRLAERYDVRIRACLVPPPRDDAAPDRERLVAYSRLDAQRLAAVHGLSYRDPGRQPDAAVVAHASQALLRALAQDRFIDEAGPLSQALWQPEAAVPGEPGGGSGALQTHLAQSARTRDRLGHYLGATFHYGGEWYWGVDRLHHLERRLQALGAARRDGLSPPLLFPPSDDLARDTALDAPATIEFFFSLRSPYSAIVAPRVFELARRTGAAVELRYLLPMVMRGLPVPRAKRMYISQDAVREARLRGIPFGRLNDPLGKPTERGLALIPWAQRQGRAEAYVLAFMDGVWARGLDAGSDRGLRRIVETAGLPWDGAREALRDEGWRAVAEANRQALQALGLWGVPSFRVGDLAVWGQDRLGLVQAELLRGRTSGLAGAP